jgi:hypothetical protein
MAKQDETDRTATGQGLIQDDRWLVTNLLDSESWGQGGPKDVLDGSAWTRFAERMARLGERLLEAAPEGSEIDRADGLRYLAMLIRNAFDVAIEDHDPDRPRFNWLTRRNKIGWDCPDALYGFVAIRDDATYRIRGRRGNVHFLGLQVMGSIRGLHNLHADELALDSGGSFELVAGGPQRPGNWIPLDAGADTIWVRQFFYDWERESPASLWIDRVDAAAGGARSGRLDAGFMARRLDALARNVESNVDLWLDVSLAQREWLRNVFPEEAFGGSEMGAQKHQTAGTGWFALEDDEALILEVVPPRARYWSVDLCNFWLESLDYANHQSSLNGHQARLDSDGAFRAVVCQRDPGVANWLDPVGHNEGSMIYRWNLAESTPVPETRVVRLSELRDHLPRDTPEVDPAERARAIEVRREHVRRRFARPL